MRLIQQIVCALGIVVLIPPALAQTELVAIDVLLQPGPEMLAEAVQWNARMREVSPDGFELDDEHTPHITLIQRFIATSDLPNVLVALDEVKSKINIDEFRLTATGIYHIPVGNIGLAGIVIEPSEQLIKLQQTIISAVDVYARTGGAEAAFAPDKSGTPFNPLLFDYVETFVPAQTGKQFNPHLTIGVAPLNWLEELEKEQFEKFTFGVSGIATYQIGNFGTASKRLDHSH